MDGCEMIISLAIGHVKQPPSTPSENEHCGTTTEHDLQYKSNSVVYADCNASNRGLFAGKCDRMHQNN